MTQAQIRKAWDAIRDIERDYLPIADELSKTRPDVPKQREIERQLQSIKEVKPSEF
jgi:hypothetical protein